MKRRNILSMTIASLFVLVLVGTNVAQADGTYTITDLGTLPGKANSWTWQQSINEKGEVAVYANDINDPNAFFSDLAYVWSRGSIIELEGIPGATSVIPTSLNNHGLVSGYSRQEGGFQHAVLWDHTVRIQLPELPGDTRGNTYVVNDRGQVCGFTRHPDPSLPFQIRHAVVWNKIAGSYVAVRLPGLTSGLTGDAFDQAFGINERGDLCGESGPYDGAEHPVIWRNGQVADLGTLGGPTGIAVAINNRRQIVGLADSASGMTLPFFWENGVMRALPIPMGEVYGLAQGINQKGEAVGFSLSDFDDLTHGHALVWKRGKVTDLQTKILVNSGWKLLQACGINNRGQISGFGVHNGQFRAFILTPNDENEDD